MLQDIRLSRVSRKFCAQFSAEDKAGFVMLPKKLKVKVLLHVTTEIIIFL